MNATASFTPFVDDHAGGADALPHDLIEARHASRIAQIHVSGIKRWVLKGKLRGWKRCGRLFVSRAELTALFEPVATAAEARAEQRATMPSTRRQR